MWYYNEEGGCLIYIKLIAHKTGGGKDVITDFIKKLPVKEKIDWLSILEAMESNNFNVLNTKTWQGKIKEVYFYKFNRIFYIVQGEEIVYLLHACKKQKNKTENIDKQIVIKRAKELEIEIGIKILWIGILWSVKYQ